MKVLLTGATGFVGSHVARELVKLGLEVHATMRDSSSRARIADIEGRIRIWTGGMDSIPIEPDLAIHLAWITTPGVYMTSEENRSCLERSLRLLSKLQCRAVFAGTCFEFDTTGSEPLREDSPVNPLSLYASCKNILRHAVVDRPRSAWVRLFYLYGPWENPSRRIPTVIQKVLRGKVAELPAGDERRDYLHVEDVARAITDVALSSLSGTVNIGSGNAPRTADVMMAIGGMVGRPELIHLGSTSDAVATQNPLILADNSRLRSTGWMPKYNLIRGLARTVEWWRSRTE